MSRSALLLALSALRSLTLALIVVGSLVVANKAAQANAVVGRHCAAFPTTYSRPAPTPLPV